MVDGKYNGSLCCFINLWKEMSEQLVVVRLLHGNEGNALYSSCFHRILFDVYNFQETLFKCRSD